MANFKKNNRYTNGNTFKTRDDKDFIVLRRPLNLEMADNDVFITIDQSLLFRPDLISNNAYGTSELWWVIYEFNSIKDPLFDMRIGQILRIPDKTRVLEAINRLNL